MMRAMTSFMSLPVPIVFVVCEEVRQRPDGGIDVFAVYDRLNLRLPSRGIAPPVAPITIVTCWTGGGGPFEQVLRPLDADGRVLAEDVAGLTLPEPAARHWTGTRLTVPVQDDVYTLTVGRLDIELLRQTFTVAVTRG